jgi:hypothetical protein
MSVITSGRVFREARGSQRSDTPRTQVNFRLYGIRERIMKTTEEQGEGMEGRQIHSVAVKLLTGQSQRTDNLRKKFCGIFHPTYKSLFCVF